MLKWRCLDSLPGTSQELKINSIRQIKGCPKWSKSLEWVFRNPFLVVSSSQESNLLDREGLVSLIIEEVDHG